MSRDDSRRGGEFDSQIGLNGRAVANGLQSRPPSKTGDLTKFGKITGSKQAPVTFGTSGNFANKDAGRRTYTIPQRHNKLSGHDQSSLLAREGSSASIIDFSPARHKPGDNSRPETITEEQALKQIDEDVKELMSIRNVDEAEVYFTKLPVEHRHRLVDKLVVYSLHAKEDIVELVAKVFARCLSKNLCSAAIFEKGFLPAAEMIDDIVVDAPKAQTFFLKLMHSAGLDDERRERLTRSASKKPRR
jgi:translation initiation factor 4G